jgi:hypothetical protein
LQAPASSVAYFILKNLQVTNADVNFDEFLSVTTVSSATNVDKQQPEMFSIFEASMSPEVGGRDTLGFESLLPAWK